MTATSAVAWERYVAVRFDESVDSFPDSIPFDDPRLQAIRASIPEWNGLRVLDLGCGRGRYWRHWQAWGADVSGLDISRKSLRRNADSSLRVVGSLARLPWPDGHFDIVCLFETLQHLSQPEFALKEAVRVLAMGGKLAIVDRNPFALDPRRPWLPSTVVKWIDQRRGLWMYPPDAPVRERWRSASHWRRQVAGNVRHWQVSYSESSEEPACGIRRKIPLSRPFYCLVGEKAA